MAIGLVLMTCIAIVFVVVSLRLHYQLLNERDNAVACKRLRDWNASN